MAFVTNMRYDTTIVCETTLPSSNWWSVKEKNTDSTVPHKSSKCLGSAWFKSTCKKSGRFCKNCISWDYVCTFHLLVHLLTFIVLLLSRRLLVSSLPILLMGSIYIYVYGIIYIWTYIFVLFICRFIHLYSFSVFSGVVGSLLVHLVNGQYGGGLGLSWGNLESLSCS